jgi:type II restriction enzyme
VDLSLRAELAAGYHSWSQIGRVLPEDWVHRELPCLRCSRKPLTPTPRNTKTRDFDCDWCGEPYELKSTKKKFGRMVADGQFDTLLGTVTSNRVPNFLLLEYDSSGFSVRNLIAIHRTLISPESIRPRKPLSDRALRKGWVGSTMDLALIPPAARVSVVYEGLPIPWPIVSEAWGRFEFMIQIRPENQGWIRDVLALVQKLPPGPFHPTDLYQFENRLRELHPNNRNIGPKIRQQLQFLVAQGALTRVRRGVYLRVE